MEAKDKLSGLSITIAGNRIEAASANTGHALQVSYVTFLSDTDDTRLRQLVDGIRELLAVEIRKAVAEGDPAGGFGKR